MLSRFVIAFLPESKGLLILWLQSLPAVILEPKKVKSFTVSIVSPSVCHEVMGPAPCSGSLGLVPASILFCSFGCAVQQVGF